MRTAVTPWGRSNPRWRIEGRRDGVNVLGSWQTKEGLSRSSVSSWAKVSHLRCQMSPRKKFAFIMPARLSHWLGEAHGKHRQWVSVPCSKQLEHLLHYIPSSWKPARYVLMVAVSTTCSRKYPSALLSYGTVFQRKKKGEQDGRNSTAWWITWTSVTTLMVILHFPWGPAFSHSHSSPFQCGWARRASKITKKHKEMDRKSASFWSMGSLQGWFNQISEVLFRKKKKMMLTRFDSNLLIIYEYHLHSEVENTFWNPVPSTSKLIFFK